VPVPPLSAARLLGDFSVTARTVSRSGYSNYETPTFGWHFTPRCRTGTCDVVWRDIGRDRIHAKLERKGPRYAGQYPGPFMSECNGSPTTSSVSLSLKVEKARALAGEWRDEACRHAGEFGVCSGGVRELERSTRGDREAEVSGLTRLEPRRFSLRPA
jgi:hypothetical protein